MSTLFDKIADGISGPIFSGMNIKLNLSRIWSWDEDIGTIICSWILWITWITCLCIFHCHTFCPQKENRHDIWSYLGVNWTFSCIQYSF